MKTRIKKTIAFLVADIVILASTMVFSFLLRFDGVIPAEYIAYIPYYIGLSLLLTLPLLFWRKLYSFTWIFVSLNEIIELFKVILLSGVLFYGVYAAFMKTDMFTGFPRSIIILHYSLAFLLLGGLRSAKRIALLLIHSNPSDKDKKNAFIIGAGERAEELVRTLQRRSNGYRLLGILDDDLEKQGTLLHGIKVLGTISQLPDIAPLERIEALIIALPDEDRTSLKKTLILARKLAITDIKILPTLHETLSGKNAVETLRSVQVEDLLGRQVAKIENKELEQFIKGKRILITGAAGSIGSELCRQIGRFDPRSLHVLDQEESNLFTLVQLLTSDHPNLTIHSYIADIRNAKKISSLMEKIKPHMIFHAAAYKHVPLMEQFPEEAIATNVFGTLHLAKAAIQAKVEKFVLISTDKAVRPVSVMGKTKKLAEMIVQAYNGQYATQFVSVRFGNVLGSRGSVLPIFQEQIRRRLPITVTDERMTRYFMTAPEACLLVLEAAASGSGGEIFVLDMGKPVKIVDLARELIRLSGLKPDRDIPIVYTKARPGEKLFEDIFNNEEGMIATQYQKVFRAKTTYHLNESSFLKRVENLKTYMQDSGQLAKEFIKLVG